MMKGVVYEAEHVSVHVITVIDVRVSYRFLGIAVFISLEGFASNRMSFYILHMRKLL
jgi:hypothetical protein